MLAFLGRLAEASIALGLLAVGAALQMGGAAGVKGLAAWLIVVKLLLLPLVAVFVGPLLGLSGLYYQVAVLFAALPTASSAYILAVREQVFARLGPENERVFPLKPGAVELLTCLAERQVPCALASSTHSEEIRRRLAAVNVLRFFQAVAGSDEVARGKPDPAVYELAARRIKQEPTRCLVFEDSENGATAALRAGMTVVIVPDIRVPQIEGPLAILPSLSAALPYLPRWFP